MGCRRSARGGLRGTGRRAQLPAMVAATGCTSPSRPTAPRPSAAWPDQHFKGRLPYHLHTRSTIVALEPGARIEAEVDGDLRGRGVWTLTATAAGTHVCFAWTVHADRPLLRALTPLLRPLLRANHAWAIARAIDGLEPYVRARGRTATQGSRRRSAASSRSSRRRTRASCSRPGRTSNAPGARSSSSRRRPRRSSSSTGRREQALAALDPQLAAGIETLEPDRVAAPPPGT